MFDVTEKTVTRFIVNDVEFDTKKEALLHATWLRLEYNLTEGGWHSIENALKNYPLAAVAYLTTYQAEVDAINLYVSPFRYDNIQWAALEKYKEVNGLDTAIHYSWYVIRQYLDHLVHENQKINAIKFVRVIFAVGLKEAKEWVEERWISRDFTLSDCD